MQNCHKRPNPNPPLATNSSDKASAVQWAVEHASDKDFDHPVVEPLASDALCDNALGVPLFGQVMAGLKFIKDARVVLEEGTTGGQALKAEAEAEAAEQKRLAGEAAAVEIFKNASILC